jgi:LmbE family N-acetylglucosaminyl deacetylase
VRRTHPPSPLTFEPPPLDRTWSYARRSAEPFRLPAVPTLVVAPHPDDETLMAGGLIAAQRARAVDVQVLAVTDGEAAYESADRQDLAAQRRSEQLAALAELGVGPDDVTRLALPDGAVAEHIDELADAIASFEHVGLVVAPWTGDHHCDHEAVGAAARIAVGRTGGALIFGLFWTWHRRTPDDLVDERMLELRLDADGRRRRRKAIRCHQSQFVHDHGAPQLTPELVRPLGWQAEYYLSPQRLRHTADDVARRDALLVTGVPPVTSHASEVQT